MDAVSHFLLVVSSNLFLFVYSDYIYSCSFVSRKKFLCMHYLSINPLLCGSLQLQLESSYAEIPDQNMHTSIETSLIRHLL